MPGAWRTEFDSYPQWIASPLARRDQPPSPTSPKPPVIPFPLAPIRSTPPSESPAAIPEEDGIIQPHSRNPLPRHNGYVGGERIFCRKAFISAKKPESLIGVTTGRPAGNRFLSPPPPTFSRLSYPDPSRRKESPPRLREIYRKARESSTKIIAPVQKPSSPIKPLIEPTAVLDIQETPRPETLKFDPGAVQSPSIHDVSMLDATPPSSNPLLSTQPHTQSPIDVDMPDAPPIKRVHWISGSAINGKLLACAPKHFYDDYMIDITENSLQHTILKTHLNTIPPPPVFQSLKTSPRWSLKRLTTTWLNSRKSLLNGATT